MDILTYGQSDSRIDSMLTKKSCNFMLILLKKMYIGFVYNPQKSFILLFVHVKHSHLSGVFTVVSIEVNR